MSKDEIIGEAKKEERERIVALLDLLRWSSNLGVSLALKELIVNAINEQDEEYIRYLQATDIQRMFGNWTYGWMKKTAEAMCPDLPYNPNEDGGDNGGDDGGSIKSSHVGPRGRYGGQRSRRAGHMGSSSRGYDEDN